MTFIETDKCYSCNRYSNTVREIYIDNFLGKNRYGWICCEDCMKFVLIDKTFRETKMECLPTSSYNEFSLRNVKFWRESKNKAISPYLIENARIETDEANGLHYQNKYDTMCAVISWPAANPLPGGYSTLMKAIPLANLIFYNRDIFGYKSKVMKDKILSKSKFINNQQWLSKWLKLINKHYNFANTWLEFYKTATRYKIPREITLEIMKYWGMFTLN